MGAITGSKKILVFGVSFALVMSTVTERKAFSQNPQSGTSSSAPASYSGQGTPLTAGEIDSFVSPIALYPDALVAQILGAVTFPDQIAVANYWPQRNKSLTGSALMQAVDKQSWDPSGRALTQFSSVLNQRAQNLTWASQLGEVYHHQQAKVMSATQALRKQAETAGNLKTTAQQTVKTETQSGQQIILIQPSNPQAMYVPTYNPTVVYGTPYNPPGDSTADLMPNAPGDRSTFNIQAQNACETEMLHEMSAREVFSGKGYDVLTEVARAYGRVTPHMYIFPGSLNIVYIAASSAGDGRGKIVVAQQAIEQFGTFSLKGYFGHEMAHLVSDGAAQGCNDYILRDPQMEADADALAARTLGTGPVKAFLERVLVLTKGQNWDARHRLEALP